MEKIVSSPENDEIVIEAKKDANDAFDKYCRLCRKALERNVITQEEYDCVYGQLYELSWGRGGHGAKQLAEGE